MAASHEQNLNGGQIGKSSDLSSVGALEVKFPTSLGIASGSATRESGRMSRGARCEGVVSMALCLATLEGAPAFSRPGSTTNHAGSVNSGVPKASRAWALRKLVPGILCFLPPPSAPVAPFFPKADESLLTPAQWPLRAASWKLASLGSRNAGFLPADARIFGKNSDETAPVSHRAR